jgi:hypothetical protein
MMKTSGSCSTPQPQLRLQIECLSHLAIILVGLFRCNGIN